MAWTEEQKQEAIQRYTDSNPTAENSVELVKKIADEMGQPPNGLRMVLSQAGVYIKKDPSTASTAKTKTKAEGDAPKRVSKDAQLADLREAIEAKGGAIDEEILSKLTGKAAAYFTQILTA